MAKSSAAKSAAVLDAEDERRLIRDANTRLLKAREAYERANPFTLQPLEFPLPKGVRREPGPQRFFCAGFCGQEVPSRGGYCPPCGASQNRFMRAMYLGEALESLSPGGVLNWCRHGNEQYRKRGVAKAVAAAERLSKPQRVKAMEFLLDGDWARARGNLLVLGPKRIGKTNGVIALGHRILDTALQGGLPADAFRAAMGLRLVTGMDLANARKQCKLGEEPAILKQARAASILILDEIGFECDRFDPHVVRDLIYDRYRGSGTRPILATSGCTMAELKARYSAACVERLTDVGEVIDLHGGA